VAAMTTIIIFLPTHVKETAPFHASSRSRVVREPRTNNVQSRDINAPID